MENPDDNFYIQRTFTLPRTTKLTEEVVQQLDNILEFSSPDDYRNTLIEIYHLYIIHEHNTLPLAFERMANQMFLLIDFLKVAGIEMSEAEHSESTKLEVPMSNKDTPTLTP